MAATGEPRAVVGAGEAWCPPAYWRRVGVEVFRQALADLRVGARRGAAARFLLGPDARDRAWWADVAGVEVARVERAARAALAGGDGADPA